MLLALDWNVLKQYVVTSMFYFNFWIYYIIFRYSLYWIRYIVGKQLSMLEDTTVRSDSHVLDLHVYRDMLIVPRCDENKVLFYQLNWTGIMYIVTRVSFYYLREEKFCI